jgi:hypothetical protein
MAEAGIARGKAPAPGRSARMPGGTGRALASPSAPYRALTPAAPHVSAWSRTVPSASTYPRAARPTSHAVPVATEDCEGRIDTDDCYPAATASERRLCACAACRAARRPVPASAVDGERPGTSGPAWRPAGQAAGQSSIPASGQRDDEALEASAVNDAAVAAYRLSAQAGNPLSERRLAQMFGRTSRRWARARIADARQESPLLTSPLPDSPSIPVTAAPAPTLALGGSTSVNFCVPWILLLPTWIIL